MDNIKKYLRECITKYNITSLKFDKIKIISSYGYYKIFYNTDFICFIDYKNINDTRLITNLVNSINQYNDSLKNKILPCLFCITSNNNFLLEYLILYIQSCGYIKIILIAKNDKFISFAVKFNLDYIISSKSDYKYMIQTGLTYIKSSLIFGDSIIVTNNETIININVLQQTLKKFNQFYGFGGSDNTKKLVIENNKINFYNIVTDKIILLNWFLIHKNLAKTLNWTIFDNSIDIYDIIESYITKYNIKILKINYGNSICFGDIENKYITKNAIEKLNSQELDILNNFNKNKSNPYSVKLTKYLDNLKLISDNKLELPIIQLQNIKPKYDPLYNYSKPTLRIMDTLKESSNKIIMDKFYFICIEMNKVDFDKKIKSIKGLEKLNYIIINGNTKSKVDNHLCAINDAITKKYSKIAIIEDKLVSEEIIYKFKFCDTFPTIWDIILLLPTNNINNKKILHVPINDKKYIYNINFLVYCLHSNIFKECINLINKYNNIYEMLFYINKKETMFIYYTDMINQHFIINKLGKSLPITKNNIKIIKPTKSNSQNISEKKSKEIINIKKPNKLVINSGTNKINTHTNNNIIVPYNKDISNKIVQSLWIGSNLSLNEILCIISFIKNGHEFHLYVYSDIQNIPSDCIIKNGNDILPASEIFYYNEKQSISGEKRPTAFSNMFRYKLLLDKGGYWVDMDMICIKYLGFSEPYVFSSECTFNRDQTVNAGIIKCPIGSDFAKYCFKICKEKNKNTLKWGEIGPRLVAESISKYKLHHYIKPWNYFCPIGYDKFNNIITPNVAKIDKNWYCIHLWNEFWIKNKLDKNKIYYGSLFGHLVNKYCKNYISHDIFNLELEFGKYNKSCVLFYWMPKDDALIDEIEKLLFNLEKPDFKKSKEFIKHDNIFDIYNINKCYVHKENATADKNKIHNFIYSDIYVFSFIRMLELGLIDNLHIIFGMAKNDKYVYNNEPLFTNGNYYNFNDKIFLWKLNDIKSLFSFSHAKLYFYKGYGNYEHFYSLLTIVSPYSIFTRYLATALPYTIDNSTHNNNIIIDDKWIETYAQNNICKKKIKNNYYFSKYYTNYDLLYIDSIEKKNNYKKLFINTKNIIKLNKFSLMEFTNNSNRQYDLLFCASDVHPSKNWEIFFNFLTFCDKNKKQLHIMIITPIILDSSLSKYNNFKNIKITIKKGLTSSQMNDSYNSCKNLLITFGRDANPRVMHESLSCGCYNIVLDILSDGKDIIKNNPILGKIISVSPRSITFEPSYKSVKCLLSNLQFNEIYDLIQTKHNHELIADTFKKLYNESSITKNMAEQIFNIQYVKNKMVVTLATENYSSNLNYLLSSIKHTNPNLMVFIFYIGWRDSLINEFKNNYPFYYFEEYKLDQFTKGDIIKLKVKLQHIIYFKFKIPFLWIDADSVVLKNLLPIFDSIKDYNLICYYRPHAEIHMKFAVGVIAFGLSSNIEKQQINEKFIDAYYKNSQITKGVGDWFYDQTSLYETFLQFKNIKLYELDESEHSINDTINTIVYSRRLKNKHNLREILTSKNIEIIDINFDDIELKYHII